jgi:signal transduction histidine kinase
MILPELSLRAKLAGLLVAASVIPLGVSAFLDIRDMRAKGVQDAEALLTARAEQISRELDSTHEGYRSATVRVANLPAVKAYCGASDKGRLEHQERLQGIFSTFNKSDDAIHGVLVMDNAGRIALASERALIGADRSKRPNVIKALKGESVISDIVFGLRQGQLRPTVIYSEPVRDEQNRVMCVVALGVDAEVFWKVLRSSHGAAGLHSYAVLYDELGIRIGSSLQNSLLYRPAGELGRDAIESQVALNRFGPRTREYLEDVRAFPGQFERARAVFTDPEVFRGFAPRNETVNLGVARRLASVPWTVFYMVPEQNILAEISRATHNKLLLVLGIMGLSAGLGLVFAASLLRPIRALDAATAALAGGVDDVRVPVNGHDELARLGSSFNAMADRIQAQANDLQKTNDALRTYSSGLEVANKDLDAFAHSVSHDLRAPLQVVDGFSRLLAKKFMGQLDEKSAQYLTRIRSGVVLMEQLVEGLLRLSRLGRQPLEKGPIDMAGLVNDVLLEMPESMSRHCLVEIPAGHTVLADGVLLRQVLSNLLSNACKFSSQKEHPEIRIGCRQADGKPVYFVRDNGAGFDPAQANHLFEPFQRLHGADEFAGLGIGLSIVKRILERHGGRIWVEAAPGEGACFYFTLGDAPAAGDGQDPTTQA